MTVITEKETIKASEIEPASESTAEELLEPTLNTEKQPEAERESAPPTKPEPAPALPTQTAPEATPEPETSNNSSEDMVYVPGFGWIESQGLNHVDYAEDMYENGNKIGSMG